MERIYLPCELNPLHFGHKYLIESIKASSCTQIVMGLSGAFVQRGEAAIFHKKQRAAAAIEAGADLIIQLPHIYATANAQDFARGHINNAKLTESTAIAFGVENCDPFKLKKAARLIARGEGEKLLKEKAQANIPYPTARISALNEITGDDYSFLRKANNILALEYSIAAERYLPKIDLIMIERKSYPSASVIRKAIIQGEDAAHLLPQGAYPKGALNQRPHSIEDYASLFRAMLFIKKPDEIALTRDLPTGLENRLIQKAELLDSDGVEAFAQAVAGKLITKSRVRRLLLDCALAITNAQMAFFKTNEPHYLRILAANSTGRMIIKDIRKQGIAEIITKLPDSLPLLSEASRKSLDYDIHSQNLWDMKQPGSALNDDYRYTPYIKE